MMTDRVPPVRPASASDAAGFILLGIVLAVIATVALAVSHEGALIYVGAISCIARGIRLARHKGGIAE